MSSTGGTVPLSFYYFSLVCSSFALALSFQFKVKEQIHCGIEYLL